MSRLARMLPGKGWRWPLVVIALVALGGWWTIKATTRAPGSWTPVERDDLILSVEVNGNLKSVDTIMLGPPQTRLVWQFKIAQLATEGDDVKAGTPVLAFDTTDLQQRLQRQQAEARSAAKRIDKAERQTEMSRRQEEFALAEAESRKRKAELTVEVPSELSEGVELAKARLDLQLAEFELSYRRKRLESSKRSAEAYLAALRAQRDRAEQQVKEITTAIEDMTRKAPKDGTVIHVTDWNDEKKKVGDQCWRGDNVIELPDLSRMKALGRVHEADAGKLEEGQRVEFRLDAHPDVEFGGQVSSIWSTVQRESWRTPLKVVRLEIELDETDEKKMRPGMRFRGTIETDRVEDTLMVPAEAVFLTDEGPVVYRRAFMGYETVPVKLGRRNEAKVEVLEGLSEGDSVSLVDPEAAERSA